VEVLSQLHLLLLGNITVVNHLSLLLEAVMTSREHIAGLVISSFGGCRL
jgi:hypothetical protein